MKVVVTTEAHMYLGPDGRIYSTDDNYGYAFWQRYLAIFERVIVVARVGVDKVTNGVLVTGDGVTVVRIPDFTGPVGYLKSRKSILEQISSIDFTGSTVILRVPGIVATALFQRLGRSVRYGVEVLGDPQHVFSRGAVKHPLRVFFRNWFTFYMRQQCFKASAASYVTSSYLQDRYPCHGPSFIASDVLLEDRAFANCIRHYNKLKTVHLVSIGSLAQLYKGPDLLLEAVNLCRIEGFDVRLTWLGDGRFRDTVEACITELGLSDYVTLAGHVKSKDEVRRYLDAADLFVLASRTEGLPRALLEAMARGLPCIATNVGGIPELLMPNDLVPPDSGALARKIMQVITQPDRMNEMACRNLNNARKYELNNLMTVRNKFYKHLSQLTLGQS